MQKCLISAGFRLAREIIVKIKHIKLQKTHFNVFKVQGLTVTLVQQSVTGIFLVLVCERTSAQCSI